MTKIIEFNKNSNSNETNERLEKMLLLYNQTKDEKYLEMLDMLYNLKRVEYEIIIQKEEDLEWKQNFGMGFWFVLNEFNTKPMIKDFMAKYMLEEIYKEDKEFNIEKYLHSRFNSKEALLKIGIRNYILNSIYGYDESLNGYLTVHLDLLEDVENKLNGIILNWDKYESDNKKTFEELLDVTDEFVKGTNCFFSTVELAYYLRFALGYEWSDEFRELVDDDNDVSDEEFYRFMFDNLDLQTQKTLLDYRKFIKNFENNGEYPDAYVIEQSRIKKLQLRKSK